MYIIYAINIIILTLWLISSFSKNNKYQIGTILIFLILLFAFTFKSPVTSDANNYYALYKLFALNFHEELQKASENFYIGNEIFFLILNYSTYKFFNNYFILNFILGIILLLPVFLTIYKYSYNIYFSLFLFVTIGEYFPSYNISRQIIACSICFFAYRYIDQGNLLKYILFVLIASMIHKSAFIMLPFYFLLRLNLNINLLLLFC